MPAINPLVIDLSHHNTMDQGAGGFNAVYAKGYRGIIHKATEGTGVVDITYALRRAAATKAGLMWGAYHFFHDAPLQAQLDHFLSVAQPDANTLIAIDHERSPSQPTLEELRLFASMIAGKFNRKPVIYYGDLLKEQLGSKADPFFAGHRSWLANYSDRPRSQASWSAPWLHQFTGDGAGPQPHNCPGIVDRGLDINSYQGTADQLKAEWAS